MAGRRKKLPDGSWIRIPGDTPTEHILEICRAADPLAKAKELGVEVEEVGRKKPPQPPPVKKDGTRYPTSTGDGSPEVDMSNWRVKLQEKRIKFDDRQKGIFLKEIAEHSRKGDACAKAGISGESMRYHLKNDPDFREAFTDAMDAYRDKVVDHAQTLLFEGETETKYDKDGNLLSERQHYPIQLISMELKKVDPAYRENGNGEGGPNVQVNVGVLLVPADQDTDAWIAEQRAANAKRLPPSTLVDVDFEEVQED